MGVMTQDTMTRLATRISMPMVGFCLLGLLTDDAVSSSVLIILSTWTGLTMGTLLSPGLRRSRDTIDLVGSLILTCSTGFFASPFVPVLLLVVALSGFRYGARRALRQAFVTTVVIAMAFMMTASESVSVSHFLGSILALSLTLHGLALLGGRLAGRWHDLEEQHDQILWALEEGIVVTDRSGFVIEANPAAKSFLRFPTVKSWEGVALNVLLRRNSDREFMEALTQPADTQRDVQWNGRDGIERSFRIRTTLLESGLLLSVFTDRTAERRAFEAEARLTHLQELDELSLGLAHEIRNPLASLRGAAEELSAGRLSEVQTERMTRIITRESDRLDRTVNNFLDYSARRKTQKSQKVEASKGVNEVIETIRERTDCSDMSICSEIESGLFIQSDRDAWNSIVSNLAINAIEACSGVGVLKISLSQEEKMILLRVSDDGPGMSEAVKKKVFHPFFTTKPREGGLGLAIVRKIVEESGGWIDLETGIDSGTEFTIGIPGIFEEEILEMKAGQS